MDDDKKLKLKFRVIHAIPPRLRENKVRHIFLKNDIFRNKVLIFEKMIKFVLSYIRRITHKDTYKNT